MDTRVLREIHRYWFGDLPTPETLNEDKLKLWFHPSDEIDTHIRETFGPSIADAAAIDWQLARSSREEAVALVVLFDQFPRNILRESAEQFAHDARARTIARALIASGIDRFAWAERNALLLPFEHSEDAADQDYAVMLMAEAAVASPPNWLEMNRNQLDYGTKHRDIIRKFGRFPHRNALLGRESTPEEVEFLKSGRGF